MNRVREIELEIKKLRKEKSKAESNFDYNLSFEDYCIAMEIYNEPINILDRERRMIMDYVLSDIPDYGDVMTLDDFIENCNVGNFIDYDGSGNYIKDNKKTNISIYPSDVEANQIRKEFDKIIWFNR